jgi:hypothetical protein
MLSTSIKTLWPARTVTSSKERWIGANLMNKLPRETRQSKQEEEESFQKNLVSYSQDFIFFEAYKWDQ